MTTLTPSPPRQDLPKVSKLPVFMQTLETIFRPSDFLERMRDSHGDIFTIQTLGFAPGVVLSHPQDIETVFTTDPNLLDTASNNKVLQPLLGEFSILQLDGQAHQRQRKLLMPPFHGSRMKAYGDLICEITQQLMKSWTVGASFPMRTATQEISLRVILEAVFGLNEGDRYEALRHRLSTMLDSFNSAWRSSFLFIQPLQKDWGAWSPWGRFLRQKQAINELLLAEIRQRKQQPPGEDILSLMLLAEDEAGQPMTEEEIRDELMTLLFAGHETTASALAWAFYWVHRLPEVKEKLLAELATVDIRDSMAVAKLPYLNAVILETLRLYPVVLFTFARVLKAPLQLRDYTLSPGTLLAPCIYLTHQRPDLYPHPKQFKPERFLERQYTPYEYLPFGGSNRRCIGYAFAQFEMKLVLAKVLSQVKLELLDHRPLRSVRRGITFTPEGGVMMKVLQ